VVSLPEAFKTKLTESETWRRQRKFNTMHLLETRKAEYHGVIDYEAKRLIVQLLQNKPGDCCDYGDFLEDFATSVAGTLSYGAPIQTAALAKNANDFIYTLSPAGAVANIFRPLSLLPRWLSPGKRFEQWRHAHEWDLFSSLMEISKKKSDSGRLPGSQAATIFSKGTSIDKKESTYLLGGLTTISIITITSPLRSFVLAMVLHPCWQDAARKEIDKVCGDRIPTLSDSPLLPVLRAIMKETLRWRPVTPLGAPFEILSLPSLTHLSGVPHELEEDDIYEGHLLKKGTLVFAGDW
jgi:cytochrome P450